MQPLGNDLRMHQSVFPRSLGQLVGVTERGVRGPQKTVAKPWGHPSGAPARVAPIILGPYAVTVLFICIFICWAMRDDQGHRTQAPADPWQLGISCDTEPFSSPGKLQICPGRATGTAVAVRMRNPQHRPVACHSPSDKNTIALI